MAHHKVLTFALLFLSLFAVFSPNADASVPLIIRGIGKTLFSVVQLPISIARDSTTLFPLGLVSGTLKGTVNAVAGTLGGAVDIARGAAPYAKYAVFAL